MRNRFELTDFVREQVWDPDKAGTTIDKMTPWVFEHHINNPDFPPKFIHDGYADFCKLFVYENFAQATLGTISLDQVRPQDIRTGYHARNENELPVLVRWIRWPEVNMPKAKYLVVVAYDANQMAKEGTPIKAEWGIVAILGQQYSEPEPMPPITMMRNALGVAEGGSGVPLDRKEYLHSVRFWEHTAVIKSTTQHSLSLEKTTDETAG